VTALVRFGNALGALGISIVLLIAFALQFGLNELPCPLCMLQRIALALCGFGLLLNLRFGPQPLHYGLVILSALLGAAVATRQVLLHIVPGSGSYGSPIMGVHLYTWSLVLFLAIIVGIAALMILEGRGSEIDDRRSAQRFGGFYRAVGYLLIALTLANAVNSFLQCGPVECDSNPTEYWVMKFLR
jgi:disulfide bond formation protein DsbB